MNTAAPDRFTAQTRPAPFVPFAGLVPINPPTQVSADGQQRYFGAGGTVGVLIGLDASVSVLRWRGDKHATVLTSVGTRRAASEVRLQATPAELRALASALVSAAHDIEATA